MVINKVRELRTKLRLSQDELALRARCSQPLISRLERGLIDEPFYTTVVLISRALRSKPGDVFQVSTEATR